MEDQRGRHRPCSLPPALDDLDLIAAIDEEASDVVMEHLRRCSACAARAREFAELQQVLRARLYRAFCPSSDELAAFQQGLLEGGRRVRLGTHLATCPHCARELRLVAEMLIPLPLPRR